MINLSDKVFKLKTLPEGLGEMAWQLRVCALSAEDPGAFPAHMTKTL